MLFALIEEQDADVEAALRDEKISTGDIYTELKRALGTGEDRVWEGILITPRVRNIVRTAEERVGEGNIEPIDLYRAIRDERGGIAADVLARLAASR